MAQQPIVSPPGPETSQPLDLGGHKALHRIASKDTGSLFSVLELIVEPGQGAEVHTHSHEDELVHVLEGQVEVTVGDQTMTAQPGVVALLPRGIPHGYRNQGDTTCRILDVILPGGGDRFFAGVHKLLQDGQATPDNLALLMERFGIH